MVIGGLSPMFGVVVLLILATAVLFALNRRAVAARPASLRGRKGIHDPRSPSPAVSGAMWPDGDLPRSEDWAWDDGTSGNGMAAKAHLSAPAPTWPIGTSRVTPEASSPAADTTRTGASPDDPVAAAVDAMLEQKTTLGLPELARLDLYRAEKVLAYADTIGGTLKGNRNEWTAEQLAAIRRYAEGKLAGGQTDGEDPADVHSGEAPVTHATPPAELPKPPLALVPALALVPPLDTPASGETSSVAGPAAIEQDLDRVALPPAASAGNEPVQILSSAQGESDAMSETLDPFWALPSETVPLSLGVVSEAPDELWPDCLAVDPFTEIATRSSGEDIAVPEDVVVEAGPALDLPALSPPTSADQDQGGDVHDASTLLEAYRVAEDVEAKCRAIDALAEEGSDLALAALQVCLDDADPTVQLHALDVAERLLSR